MKFIEQPVAVHDVPDQYRVVWTVDQLGRHTVTYGAEVRSFPKNQDLRAAECFGECVRHQVECAGRI